MSDGYSDYLESYVPVLVLVIVGCALVVSMLLGNRLLRPHRPTPAKQTTYECGVDPVGSGWAQMHVRYYVFAYLYVVFAVDAVFLFPWATVFEAFGWVTITEMAVFIGLIAVGLAYAWRKGVLTWT
jgi:NADH-quinone oxidoreductase subunit A